jgi:hypothetical protein
MGLIDFIRHISPIDFIRHISPINPIGLLRAPTRDFPQEEEIYVQGSQAGFGSEAYARPTITKHPNQSR